MTPVAEGTSASPGDPPALLAAALAAGRGPKQQVFAGPLIKPSSWGYLYIIHNDTAT